jgi:NADH-quinone oxidoreductase subunit K
MIFVYFLALSIALFAIGIAGVASSKNFLIMMLSIEISITASTLLALSFFYFVSGSNIILFMLTIWSIASAEVMALVAFYRYMVKGEISLDITKLSRLKD